MATATASKKGGRSQRLAKESRTAQESADKAQREKNERNRIEQQHALEYQAARAQAEDTTPKEGDMVTFDVLGVPEALHTTPMLEHIKRLQTMQGRSGRVVRVEETADQGRIYVVEGADFTHRAPAAAVKRADLFGKGQKKAARKKGGAAPRKRASKARR